MSKRKFEKREEEGKEQTEGEKPLIKYTKNEFLDLLTKKRSVITVPDVTSVFGAIKNASVFGAIKNAIQRGDYILDLPKGRDWNEIAAYLPGSLIIITPTDSKFKLYRLRINFEREPPEDFEQRMSHHVEIWKDCHTSWDKVKKDHSDEVNRAMDKADKVPFQITLRIAMHPEVYKSLLEIGFDLEHWINSPSLHEYRIK